MRLALLVTACAWLVAARPVLAGQSADPPPSKPGDGVTAPVIVKEVKPEYPATALADGKQGLVKLECVVKVDGTVGDVRIVESLDTELDKAAIAAIKQWTFKPGTRDGKAVPVIVEAEMSFAVRVKGPRLGSPEVVQLGPGVQAPALIKEVKPTYPVEVKQAGVQGIVVLDCVVLPDGTVGDVRVAKSLHPALDIEAIRTVRLWRFRPGRKNGESVPVQVMIEMSFSLR
jgi:TonB family protein